jgi:THO complex subunit 4
VEVSYGPNSVSRGIATVTFHKPDGASKAFNALNGILVDNRPIKIEIVVNAAQAAEIIPAPKTLTERVTQPKAQPKSAASDKKKDAAKTVGSGARGRKRRPARSSRPAKKTAEELDSEMADYFNSGDQNENTNGAAANTNGDAAMDDEIL